MANPLRETKVLALTSESVQKLDNAGLRSRLRGLDSMIVEYKDKLTTLEELEKLIEEEIRRRGWSVDEFSRLVP